ncbi:MAG: hypothetical protein ACK5XN_21805 [Bacteroidota bacterium]
MVNADIASQVAEWIEKRGGVAEYASVNLLNPSGTWICPIVDEDGKPTGKPNWQCRSEPEVVAKSLSEVEVVKATEFDRFRVRLKQDGSSLTVSDGTQNRIDTALASARWSTGGHSFLQFDYATQEAVIMVEGGKVPLEDYLRQAVQ